MPALYSDEDARVAEDFDARMQLRNASGQ